MNWYMEVLKNYFGFGGRARRREYWFFFLFNMIIGVVLVAIDMLMGTINHETGLGLLSGLYSLAILIPAIAVTFRRLHDTGKSAWWLLLYLVPFIGPLVIFVFTILDSDPSDNAYGPSPKGY